MNLVDLAKQNKLPTHQYLDWETLNWTRENGQKLLNQKIFFKGLARLTL